METEIVHELTDEQATNLLDLYATTYWAADRGLGDVYRMLEATDAVVGVADAETGDLLAFGRALTDGTFRAFVEDVIVAEEYRERGLGREVMDALLDHPELQSVESITLGCRDDVVGFYEQWGFKVADEDMYLMNRV